MLLTVRFSRISFFMLVAVVILLGVASSARGQCVVSGTGETAVSVKNASSYPLTFRVDHDSNLVIRAGQRSIELAISPGEHTLFARASSDDALTASRVMAIVEGRVCMWTITDPDIEALEVFPYRDPLRLEAVITLAVPN